MKEIKSVLIRFNLNNPEHKQAYKYLLDRNRSEYKSNSDFIAKAINTYCSEDKSDIKQIIKRCFAEVMADKTVSRVEIPVSSDNEDIAWDYIGSDKPDIEM